MENRNAMSYRGQTPYKNRTPLCLVTKKESLSKSIKGEFEIKKFRYFLPRVVHVKARALKTKKKRFDKIADAPMTSTKYYRR